MEIKLQGPYNYLRVLERLSYDPLNVIDKEKSQVKIPLKLYNELIVATVSFSGTIEAPICQIDIPAEYEEDGVRQLNEIFQLEVPLQEVNNHFLHTDLAPLFRQFSGMPLICDYDLYYCMMKTIIHQQLNIRFAYTLTERFVKSFGTEKDGVWFYPSAKTVSELTYEDLRKLQFSQRKAEYVIDTSRLIADGKIDLAELRVMTDDEVIAELVKVRGIGYWTAENILLFGLGRQNLFPVKDIGIQNALKMLYKLDEKPTLEEMLKVSEGWSPYKSYASLYLWESLDNQKARS
ncbi:DNA-3-methyladenine glycosylase 2 family protein [Anaerobacillus sp. CMMVII]|uniref:DNA-3-methyladenine glycosylase family protein n=1 Tax=Anaerobacillus sp. CMMVII TaxID=2755588 RepID=UPI0021B70ECB|nr:DNA-3-methyladenine glycosylase [Anaerobacillus sp. CMMVII]MCT8136843.1 DNA-3-methyladenine glycosylase 2 family protein [Anaerobacillus sp. CMMVII]